MPKPSNLARSRVGQRNRVHATKSKIVVVCADTSEATHIRLCRAAMQGGKLPPGRDWDLGRCVVIAVSDPKGQEPKGQLLMLMRDQEPLRWTALDGTTGHLARRALALAYILTGKATSQQLHIDDSVTMG